MNGFDISTISGIYVGSTPYSAIYKGSNLIWSARPDYSIDYFTIESLEDNNIISIYGGLGNGRQPASSSYDTVATWYYSTDKVNWTSFVVRNSTQLYNTNFITLNKNQKVYLKSTDPFYKTGITDNQGNSTYQYNYLGSSKNFKVYGNIMSLCYGDNFANQTTLQWTYTFYYLFKNCKKLVDASDLILPATTLQSYCYNYMFYGCTSLTTAPELPATTLANYCYAYMLYGCTSLTTAPELPATTLANYCYAYMFYGCTSLTTAPELPATTLANRCYANMFSGTNVLPDCTNIDFTSSTVVSSGGLISLFAGTKVTDNDLINILPKNSNNKYCLPVTTLTSTYCYNNMFSNCKSLTTAPELPATTLSDYCYQDMFYSCTSLTTVPSILPATTLSNYCYREMFCNCTSLVTTPLNMLPATTLTTYCYNYMFKGCTSLTTAPALQATTLANYCYGYMFKGCTSLTTAPALQATTLASNCYEYMFQDCTSLTTAPDLPATKLVSNCYRYMFYGCTSLNYIKALFTSNITLSDFAQIYLNQWVYNVAATGTFVKNPEATWVQNGVNGVPNGWTVVTNENVFNYFTIESLEDNNEISLTCQGDSPANMQDTKYTFEYSTDKVNWTSRSTYTNSIYYMPTIATLNTGQKLYIRSTDQTYKTYTTTQGFSGTLYNYFGSTKNFKVYGNIMSLCYGNNFANQTTLPWTYTFYNLFNNCSKLVDASDLILPATTLTNGCCQNMFSGCSSLITAPELPATTLVQKCYLYMFYGCSSLTTAPELPATTLATSCYEMMFSHCSSLTTAPSILPATTLADWCYGSMFEYCTSLTTAPEIAATTLAESCCKFMFSDCTSLTTAPSILPATTLVSNCYGAMFYNCTALTTAPELPATTLVSGCYNNMFNKCSSLNYIKALFTTTPSTTYTNNWVYNVAASGTFIKNDSATWTTTGNYAMPSTWATYKEKAEPLTIVSLSDSNTISIENTLGSSFYLYYNGNTKSISSSGTTTITTLNKNALIRITANTSSYTRDYSSKYLTFKATGDFKVRGNIMSLLNSSSFSTLTSMSTYQFVKLFYQNTYLKDAFNLILPLTTLTTSILNAYHYAQMFQGCTSLIHAPKILPATTLSMACYANMFYGCTSLTTAPKLPATTLTAHCYSQMFQGCTSLTTAPELPATTLANNCYGMMFYGCNKLNYVKAMFTTDISSGQTYTESWLYNVASLGTFVKNINATWTREGSNGIPTGWTVQTASS